jgi:hypothetical protein
VRNLQNVEETTVHTPPRCTFDSALHVQLQISKDGTAVPKFIYKMAGPDSREISKEGKKIFVDMTDASGGGGEAYLGLDFGTSNTAISYIDRNWVQLIEARSHDANWKEIGELIDELPVPLSVPLARYIGEHVQSSGVNPGFSFIEAGLCLAAYVSYLEFCSTERRATTRLFKDFPHRSASYLWHMLKQAQLQLGSKSTFSAGFKKLCEGKNLELFEAVTRKYAEVRHELTLTDKDELMRAVRAIANASYQVFSQYRFGYFEGIQKERFSNRYSGRFRVAHGKPPHSLFFEYSGDQSFSEAEALILNTTSGEGLMLTPLVLWYPCSGHRDSENGHCYVFDKLRSETSKPTATFKAEGFPCQLQASLEAGEMQELVRTLVSFRLQDPAIAPLRGLQVKEAEPTSSV